MINKTRLHHFVMVLIIVSVTLPAGRGITQADPIIALEVDTFLDSNLPSYKRCSAESEDCSLRGAISHANADSEQEYMISIGAGLFGFTLPGADEDDNQSGDLDFFGSIQISGAGTESTSIGGNFLDRVLHIHPGAVVTITDLTITGGLAPAGIEPYGLGSPGGGIYNYGNLTLENCHIEHNMAGKGWEGTSSSRDGGNGGDGGGIYNNGVLQIWDSQLENNSAGEAGDGFDSNYYFPPLLPGGGGGDSGSGGAIYNNGVVNIYISSLISNTTRDGGSGGCVYKACAAGGSGGSGGAIYNSAKIWIEDSLIKLNKTGNGVYYCSKGGPGGGIYNAGDMEIYTSVIVGNLTGSGGTGSPGCEGGKGGGIYNRHNLTLFSSEVISNTTGDGGIGSVVFFGSSGGQGGAGGGIYNSGILELVNTGIMTNKTGAGGNPNGSGGHGGGVYNAGQVMVLVSSIALNSTGSAEDDPYGTGDSTEAGNNGGCGGGVYNANTFLGSHTSVSSNTTGLGGAGGSYSDGGHGGDGGGIYNSGVLELSYGVIGVNRTGSGGDGVDEGDYHNPTDGGQGGHGGGINNQGELLLEGITIIDNLTGQGGDGGSGEITGLPGLGGFGGGIYFAESPATMLDSVVIADNMVPQNALGSGVYLQGSNVDSVHNTIARNSGGDGSGIFASQSAITLTNTILVNHTIGITATLGSTITLDTSLWGAGLWMNEENWGGAGEFTVMNELTGGPAFISPESGNYHIGELSAARDAGVWSVSTTDMDNQPRPNPDTGLADIGADEYWLFTPISEISVSGPITATAYTPITFTAQIIPEEATPNIFYVWTPIPEAGQGTESAVFTWDVEGDHSVLIIAINAASQVTSSTSITIYPGQLTIYLPLIIH